MIARLLAGIAAFLSLVGCQASPSAVRFHFDDWSGPVLAIHGVEPLGAADDAPVVIVMHGVRRNAGEYRDNWIDLAEDYGLRVYAPEFDQARFPGPEGYNLGGAQTGNASAFDAIEPLFRSIQAERGSRAETYYLFGHSAGAQFVHRAICFSDMPGLALAISANAGWYTLPDTGQAWPYGMQDAPEGACEIEDWLAASLLVMLGTQDTDPNDPSLRKAPEAMEQGQNRLERGMNFFETARNAARSSGSEFAWRIGFVEGVAHDNAGMAIAAAPVIVDHAGQSPRLLEDATQ